MKSVLEIAQDLIKKKSVTPLDDGAINYLKSYLEKLGFKCEILEYEGDGSYPVKNLYAKYGHSDKNLCFAGHTDVVPVGDEQVWSVGAFEAPVKDGFLIGRGAVDMKGAIASFTSAAEKIISTADFKGSISFLITGDEEADAINGTVKVLEHLANKGEKISACIVGEPTNPEVLGEMIKVGRRGSMNLHLEVRGVQGHVAYPHNADNPIDKLVKALTAIKVLKLDVGNDSFQPSNLEIVNIDVGNEASNVIPAKASALMNIRFNNIHTPSQIISIITKALDEVIAGSYNLKDSISAEAFLTTDNALAHIVSDSVNEVTGLTPVLSTTGGTSDARFIKDYCPVIEFGLINKTAHQVNEKISVVDLENLSDIYYKVLEKYFNK